MILFFENVSALETGPEDMQHKQRARVKKSRYGPFGGSTLLCHETMCLMLAD